MAAMSAPPYLPFTDGPWRMTMGLIAMKPHDWIEIDQEYEAYVAEKRRLLAERREAIFAALPGSEAATRELQDNLAGFLAERFPDRFTLEGRRLRRSGDGAAWDLDDPLEHPLARAGLWVQEDFCLLDRFFEKLAPERPVWRINWSLVDEPTLFLPEGHGRKDADASITAENAGERVWLRVERQTLRRLPGSGAVVFGIRIYRHPLSSLAAAPEAAGHLARWLGELPEDLARYKSLPVFGNAARAYLEGVARAAA
jgi:hypothetical protein